MDIENAILWNGMINAYLYTLKACVSKNDVVLDSKEISFGVRSFSVDSQKGFILNDKEYYLHGVSRHQDRYDKGYALSQKDHEQDMDLIQEIGATSIRLAHYQHDQYFYDLCDQRGMVTWAEIPFITMFMEAKGSKRKYNFSNGRAYTSKLQPSFYLLLGHYK